MAIAPRLVQRSANLIDIAIPRRPGVASYSLGSQVTLTDAWAGTTEFATVVAGRWMRSPSLVRGGVGWYPDSMQGLTRFSFDPTDYASATMNGDTAMQYLTVTELDAAGNDLSTSPVLVVPPSNFFATGRATLVLKGTTLAVADGPDGFPPPGSGRVLLPLFADEVTFYETGSNPMFVALGEGTPEFTVPTGESRQLTEAGAWNLFIRGGTGAAADFEATISMVNGLQS